MFSFLKNHPFAVEAYFDSSLVLTFAVPKEELKHRIPFNLELDTFSNKWAFIAIAMVQTTNLRPKGFPTFLGTDFFLIGYRIFVRYTNSTGKNLRGLYILRSETDKSRMKWLGNMLTHYRYTTTDISVSTSEGIRHIKSNRSKFNLKIQQDALNACLPDTSPFSDWKEARRFAGPLPYTFSSLDSVRKMLIVEGVRTNWTPVPVNVLDYSFSFLDEMNLTDIRLANAFIIEKVPYYWKKGKLDPWRA